MTIKTPFAHLFARYSSGGTFVAMPPPKSRHVKLMLALILGAIVCLAAFVRAGDPPTLKPQFPLPDASRPVGIWHLSDHAFVTKENPCGWNPDAGGIPGSEDWQDRYIARALQPLRRMGAQGVIIWDMEGSGLGPDAKYVGQPEIAPALNPNFDYKRFAGKIRAQHLSLGICIRANQRIVNGKPVLVPWQEQYERVRTSIAFARKEWKVKWVYVDSNSREALPDVPNAWADGWLTPSTMWWRLHKEFDVSLVPEHKDAAAHLWTVPYRQLWINGSLGETGTPAYIRRDIPRAVSFVNCSGIVADKLRNYLPALRESIQAGDVLAIDAWWPSPESAVFAEAYRWN